MSDPLIVRGDLAERTRELAAAYSSWEPGHGDLGDGLVEVFGRLADIVAARVNAVPGKNFLAFLDLVGVRLLPPQPARVPLTFKLAAGATGAVPIPAGTPVAAVPLADKAEPPLFETQRTLTATPVRLVSVVSVDSHRDRYREHTNADAGGGPFRVFEGSEPFAHALYLASEVFGIAGTKTVEIVLGHYDPDVPWVGGLEWSAWDGVGWRPLATDHLPAWEPDPHSALGSDAWVVQLYGMPSLPPTTVAGRTGRFVRAALRTTIPHGETQHGVTKVTEVGLDPDAAFADGERLDFGEPEVPFDSLDEGGTLFLSSADAFSKPGALVTIDVQLDPSRPTAPSSDLQLSWAWFTSNGEHVTLTPEEHAFEDHTYGLARSGTVTFRCPESWSPTTVNDVDGWWLRVRIETGGYEPSQPPYVDSLTIGYDWETPRVTAIEVHGLVSGSGLLPELAFASQTPIDLNKDFFLFGEKPALNDTLYLASDEALGRAGSLITLEIALTNTAATGEPPSAQPSADLLLRWEYWNESAARWDDIPGLVDGTAEFTANGQVSFTRPSELGPVTVNGEHRRWIRARIAAGNYGQEAHYVEVTRDGKKTYDLVLASYRPPSISSLEILYSFETPFGPLDAVLAENASSFQDRTIEAAAPVGTFEPFVPGDDASPALYLGFDGALADAVTSLYLGVVEPRYDARRRSSSTEEPPVVVWEYWNAVARAWRHVQAEDETHGFVRRGLVSLIGPPNQGPQERFGMTAHWLRARWAVGEYAQPPELARVLPNTMWAVHSSTVLGETLGSGNGEPSQIVRFSRAPVLTGEQIEVRELEAPPPSELADLGPGALQQVLDASGRAAEVWVRWREVGDFYASGPRSRHYALDRITGAVQFGDGRRGLPAPQGRDNVVARRYRTGGGLSGNRAAGTITELATTVPYVAGATNHEPASGGTDAETLDQARIRGPRTLRHGGRAVVIADFEDLAAEASPDIARVRGFPVRGQEDRGRVVVVVVPRSDEARPAPSIELLHRVEEYLRERTSPVFELRIVGPGWLRVSVAAEIVPRSPDEATDVESAIRARLAAFLHPLHGGLERKGWPFGRRPHRSDLYAVIESADGVDHVHALEVEETMVEPSPHDDAFLAYSGDHDLAMTGAD